jgi:5'-3' exonuclease
MTIKLGDLATFEPGFAFSRSLLASVIRFAPFVPNAERRAAIADIGTWLVHADVVEARWGHKTSRILESTSPRGGLVLPKRVARADTYPLAWCWSCTVDVYLVDGTYELFRHYYALPSARDGDGREVAAVRGVLSSVLGMIRGGATHVAVATDHVIESFRNELWSGYKTSEGVEPDLLEQFPILESVLSAAGIVVWPMVEFEADDALAAAAVLAARDGRVERVILCTPDKDLAQCVRGTRVVQLNRRTRVTLDERGVVQKFGVSPESMPDYLALVGDSADGYPGLRGWGAKSSAAVLGKYGHLESIPADWREWHVNAANASALADTLSRERDRALLFRTLATLRTDLPLFEDVEQLRWSGPTPSFDQVAARLDAARTETRRLSGRRSPNAPKLKSVAPR